MENLNDPKPDLLSSTGLQINEESGRHLRDAGQWAKAIAIITSIICGLAVLLFFAFGSFFFRTFAFGLENYAGVIVAVVLIVLVIALVAIVNLFRFSNSVFTGINNQDASAFSKGIGGLKIYFILLGVLTLLSALFSISKFLPYF